MSEEGEQPAMSDEERVAEARLLETLDKDREIAELQDLLTQEPFRDFLWRVIVRARVFSECFDANFGKSAYMLGRAALGREIIAEIGQVSPRAWTLMQEKANEIARAQAAKSDRERVRRRR